MATLFGNYLMDDIEIIRGDDYLIAIGREITWDDTDGIWPDLTGATVTFTYDTFSKVVTVTNPAANATLTLELTDTETESLQCISDAYNIKAVLTGGEICTLAIGKLIIRDDQ